VKLNACPFTGVFGDVDIPLTVGMAMGVPLLTVNDDVFDGVPPEPLRTCTLNDPAASTAAPLSWLVVRVNPDTTQAVLVEQPGPRK
jgi:hypothetical protein